MLVAALLSAQVKVPQVPTVMKNLHQAYAKVKTAKMTVHFKAGNKVAAVVELQFKAPNLIWARTTSKFEGLKGFTIVSDGVNLDFRGRPGFARKPFTLQAAQDDGPPVYKETLALWDITRQFGTRTLRNTYMTKAAKTGTTSWTILMEKEPSGDEYWYYIDPKSNLIKRTEFRKDGGVFIEYVVVNQEINGKLTAKFKF